MNSRLLAHYTLFIAYLFVLCFGNAGFAQIMVQPMIISETSLPGEVIHASLKLHNMNSELSQMSLTVIELAQTPQGEWIPLSPNQDPVPSNLKRSPSCRAWIQIDPAQKDRVLLEQDTVNEVDVTITIPTETEGTYWAAIKCRLKPARTGTAIHYDFIGLSGFAA